MKKEKYKTKNRVGETYELPLNHTLAQEKFPTRWHEIQAIKQWARANEIELRNEYCIDRITTKGYGEDSEEEIVTSATIYSYNPIPELQKEQPKPKRMPRFVEEIGQ